ncbi:MAG: hypothetical protein ABIQ15_03710 [Nocardioides sp.]
MHAPVWRSAATSPCPTTVTGCRRTAPVAGGREAGTSGSDLTRDGGRTWKVFHGGSFDAVMCAVDGACWASGADRAAAVLDR